MIKTIEKIEIESLSVEGFLALKNCSLEFKTFSVLIGPQASGKSIVAKLLYFCRTFVQSILTSGINQHETRAEFNRQSVEQFLELFPRCDEQCSKFSVIYRTGQFEVRIQKASKTSKPKISISNELKRSYDSLKRKYKRYVDDQRNDAKRSVAPTIYSFFRSSEDYRDVQASIPDTLYVPAARAFFSSIQQNVFSFLSHQKSIDPLFTHFGSFFEWGKSRYESNRRDSHRSSVDDVVTDDAIFEIIKGNFFQQKGKDYIKSSWGTSELKDSSSGQQEALPLLLALRHFPSSVYVNECLIVEEPEAHLFPKAQKKMVELMVGTSFAKNCRMFTTTHSPYMLACLNNQIHLNKRVGAELAVSSYYIANGEVTDIFDVDENLVDLAPLDEVSAEITEEFWEVVDV